MIFFGGGQQAHVLNQAVSGHIEEVTSEFLEQLTTRRQQQSAIVDYMKVINAQIQELRQKSGITE